jgi:hypothetical protein
LFLYWGCGADGLFSSGYVGRVGQLHILNLRNSLELNLNSRFGFFFHNRVIDSAVCLRPYNHIFGSKIPGDLLASRTIFHQTTNKLDSEMKRNQFALGLSAEIT